MKSRSLFLILFVASTALANNQLSSFLGVYNLESQSATGESFCFNSVEIRFEQGMAHLYRSDIPGYGPVFSAEVNGASRPVSGSHGEAGTSYKGHDKVTLKQGVLAFQTHVLVKIFSVPGYYENESYSFTNAQNRRRLTATRVVKSGPLSHLLRTKGTAHCVYKKQ